MTRILLVTTFLALPGVALAVPMTWLADSSLDEPDDVPGDLICSSKPSGVCTLRAAIDEANANPDYDVIVLIVPSTITTGVIDDTNAEGDFDIDLQGGTDGLVIMGANAIATTIDGMGHDRVFDVFGAGHFELRDVAVTNGSTAFDGGGVRLQRDIGLTLERVSIENNSAGAFGGGLFAPKNVIDITDSTFAGNTASGSGGGMYLSGYPTISNSTVSGNTAASGGGISYYDGTMDLHHVTITLNDAAAGGGLEAAIGTVNVDNSILGDNLLGGVLWPPGAGVFGQDCLAQPGAAVTVNPGSLITANLGGGCVIMGGVVAGFAPGLGPLAYNAGGTTRTHLPGVGSAVDNKANPATALIYDQNGTLRRATGPDIGACEN